MVQCFLIKLFININIFLEAYFYCKSLIFYAIFYKTIYFCVLRIIL